MLAHFMLDAGAGNIITLAQNPISAHMEFRHQKHGYASCPFRSIRQASQHQMANIFRHIMLPIGDENLVAGNFIAAIAYGLGLGAHIR